MSNIVTKDQLMATMPPSLKHNITDNLVNMVNTASNDVDELENIRGNFVNFSSVMREGRYSMEEYFNAVKYVSFKLMQHNNQEAYIRTFPDRYQNLLARGATPKEISSYVHAYNKGKLVNAIWEQSIIEPWILYNDKFSLGIKALVEVIEDPNVSNRDKWSSADKLLTHLKKPETAAGLNINIGTTVTEDTLDRLDQALDRLSNMQQSTIGNGSNAKEIAESNIINGEFTE